MEFEKLNEEIEGFRVDHKNTIDRKILLTSSKSEKEVELSRMDSSLKNISRSRENLQIQISKTTTKLERVKREANSLNSDRQFLKLYSTIRTLSQVQFKMRIVLIFLTSPC